MFLPKKKPWVAPVIKKLERTDELVRLFAEQAEFEPAPGRKRVKHS